jgi:hypothetical protein
VQSLLDTEDELGAGAVLGQHGAAAVEAQADGHVADLFGEGFDDTDSGEDGVSAAGLDLGDDLAGMLDAFHHTEGSSVVHGEDDGPAFFAENTIPAMCF